jgi:hypothetical protein
MVGPDEFEPHREGDRRYWATDDPKDFDEFWDAPTFEKWRKGGQWK